MFWTSSYRPSCQVFQRQQFEAKTLASGLKWTTWVTLEAELLGSGSKWVNHQKIITQNHLLYHRNVKGPEGISQSLPKKTQTMPSGPQLVQNTLQHLRIVGLLDLSASFCCHIWNFLEMGIPKTMGFTTRYSNFKWFGVPPTSGNLHCPYLFMSTHVYLSIYLCIYPSILLSIYRSTYYLRKHMHATYTYIPYLSLAQNNHININKTATKLRTTKQNTYLRYTFTSYSMVVDTSKYLYAYR